MAKTYRRRYNRSVNRDKYSVEHTSFLSRLTVGTTNSVAVVPPTAVRGMRKVKHLTVSIANSSSAENLAGVRWALVYVPEGYVPQSFASPTLENPSVDLYAANQFVMSCGVIDFTAGPARIRTPLSRNLNSGDQIVLLLSPFFLGGSGNLDVSGVVSYAITLQ